MFQTLAAGGAPVHFQTGAVASQESHAVQHPLAFAALLAQLAALVAVFRIYLIETHAFLVLSCLVFAGFAIHYWLPFRWKEWFFIVLSTGGAYLLLEPLLSTVLIAAGLAIFGVAASPFPYRIRLGGILALLGLMLYGRATLGFHLPAQVWPLLGALFMFRLLVYLYDLAYMKGRPSLKEFLAYFFLLPNYYFLFFPVIDFQTMRRTYFDRDIHECAQTGIYWMYRGTIQLLCYKAFYYLYNSALEHPASFPRLISIIVLSYLLYTKLSGQFHIIAGMLHLFGYGLPETNHRYLLAHSMDDLWRRINIYWKDFMVKMVYLPVYFRIRRVGDLRARVAATVAVFIATWALHAYQFFWLQGTVRVSWPDTIFWFTMGGLMVAGLLFSPSTPARRPPNSFLSLIQYGLGVARTFLSVAILWSLWSSPSVSDWVHLLRWWQPS